MYACSRSRILIEQFYNYTRSCDWLFAIWLVLVTLNFKFLLLLFFCLYCFVLFWFLTPAGEKASLQSTNCQRNVHSFDEFKTFCKSDDNSQDWYRSCVKASGKPLACEKCSWDDDSPKCTMAVMGEELDCAGVCYRSTQTFFFCGLRTCLPNGKSQTGRYH